jgi:methionyl-tRNA formyltransferase
MTRRVVILSPGGSFLDDLLALLARRGTGVQGVVLYDSRLSRAGASASILLRLRASAMIPVRWMRRQRRAEVRGAAERLVVTGALNGDGTARALRRLRPDVLVLARCGLVKPHVLAIPTEGVVNVHPGLLPWIRGGSPVGNSLLRGVPLGATAFRVDAGIDTGPMLRRRLVDVGGAETEAALRDGLYRLWLEMTAELIEAVTTGPLPVGTRHAGRFPLCRDLKGSPEQPAVDAAVRQGAARTLLARWRPLCDPEDLSLPADAQADFLPRSG